MAMNQKKLKGTWTNKASKKTTNKETEERVGGTVKESKLVTFTMKPIH